ncbi:MAG: phage tail family protein [Propionibacteriaceae bacterium]|nr:phage tail family protein [Propionibacteriaceae bacterium]
MRINGVSHLDIGVTCLAGSGEFVSQTDDTTTVIPGRDGVTWIRSTQKPRVFGVTLVARAATRQALDDLLDATAAWLVGDPARTAPGPVQLVFDEEFPDRGWTARLVSPLSALNAKATRRVKAVLQFQADDPHPHALVDDVTVLTAPGTVPRLKGNCPSEPLIEIKGVLTKAQTVTLSLWGKTVQVAGPLASGETMRLDLGEGLYTKVTPSGVSLLTGQLSAAARKVLFARERAICPAGGGPVTWTTTGTISQVRVECNSRWL